MPLPLFERESYIMNEVKRPRKPLIFYYILVLLIIFLINGAISPRIARQQIQKVDYDAFDFYHDGIYQYTRYLVLSL